MGGFHREETHYTYQTLQPTRRRQTEREVPCTYFFQLAHHLQRQPVIRHQHGTKCTPNVAKFS